MKEDDQGPDGLESEEFWMGWLVATVALTQRMLQSVEEDGSPTYTREDVTGHVSESWQRFASSDVGRANATVVDYDERSYAGFVVEDAHDRAQALRGTRVGALAALDQAYAHWDNTDTSDNAEATEYVGSLYPLRVRQVTRAEWNAILENGTPLLDREL
jgi:hypothetical protein